MIRHLVKRLLYSLTGNKHHSHHGQHGHYGQYSNKHYSSSDYKHGGYHPPHNPYNHGHGHYKKKHGSYSS
ncbi:hypothetical protein [Paenibacillus kobensis]|uniref:hypothetical protein n=1 Tax=Paenibacillus kobensis TaxID=59841 RepID=UPI000FD6EB52|nr:hypothetical protein [Paenibacillus kobensis]